MPCWRKAECSSFSYSFGFPTTRNTRENAGAHLQGLVDSVFLLRQGLCALHPLFQSVQPAGLKVQIVKKLKPTGPDLLEQARRKGH